MHVERHPTFLRSWVIGFASLWALLVGGGGALIAWGDLLPEKLKDVLLWCLLGATLLLVATLALAPYMVRCPNCSEATEPRRASRELTGQLSAFCRRCQTLWSLGLGVGD